MQQQSRAPGRQAGESHQWCMGLTLHTPPSTPCIHRNGTSTQLIFLPNAAMHTCPSGGEAGPPQMMWQCWVVEKKELEQVGGRENEHESYRGVPRPSSQIPPGVFPSCEPHGL